MASQRSHTDAWVRGNTEVKVTEVTEVAADRRVVMGWPEVTVKTWLYSGGTRPSPLWET